MRSRSAIAAIAVLAVTLVAFCLWSMAARGLYGVRVDGVVAGEQVRHEKHPPIDDVHLLRIGSSRVHVDARLADAIEPGDRLSKGRFERVVRVDGRAVELTPSDDLRRSAFALPGLLALVGGLLALSRRHGLPGFGRASRREERL